MRARGGFALVELLAAAAVSGILSLALLLLYQRAAALQARLLREQPLAQASAQVAARFVAAVRSASCVRLDSSDSLTLYQGRDCDGAALAGSGRFVVLCRDARKILRQASGPFSDLYDDSGRLTLVGAQLLACSPEFRGWSPMVVGPVFAAGGFERDAGARNRITAAWSFSLDPALTAGAAAASLRVSAVAQVAL